MVGLVYDTLGRVAGDPPLGHMPGPTGVGVDPKGIHSRRLDGHFDGPVGRTLRHPVPSEVSLAVDILNHGPLIDVDGLEPAVNRQDRTVLGPVVDLDGPAEVRPASF